MHFYYLISINSQNKDMDMLLPNQAPSIRSKEAFAVSRVSASAIRSPFSSFNAGKLKVAGTTGTAACAASCSAACLGACFWNPFGDACGKCVDTCMDHCTDY